MTTPQPKFTFRRNGDVEADDVKIGDIQKQDGQTWTGRRVTGHVAHSLNGEILPYNAYRLTFYRRTDAASALYAKYLSAHKETPHD